MEATHKPDPSREAESTLTDRYQTTVPASVRRALKIGKRDRIHYTIRRDGKVEITRASRGSGSEDPALLPFLNLLARDMAEHPERLKPVDSAMFKRLDRLIGKVEVDLEAALPDDGE